VAVASRRFRTIKIYPKDVAFGWRTGTAERQRDGSVQYRAGSATTPRR